MIMEKRAAAEEGGEGHEEEIGHHAGQQSEAYVMLRVRLRVNVICFRTLDITKLFLLKLLS